MLEVKNLSCGYPGRRVLTGISLDFRPGEVLALLGPNGSGKSTLMRTAVGLLPKLDGEILLDGRPLADLSPRQIARRTAYLPQSRPTPNITALRMALHGRFPYLSYPRRYGREDYVIARRALEETGAEELEERFLPTLSGGQRQRVYLAMALAQDTETILMDEPTAFLDVGCQLEVMALARRLAGEGRAVVLVLHDLCLALRTADRAAVLHQGHLAALDAPEALYESGRLTEIFGAALRRVGTAEGWRYYYA